MEHDLPSSTRSAVVDRPRIPFFLARGQGRRKTEMLARSELLGAILYNAKDKNPLFGLSELEYLRNGIVREGRQRLLHKRRHFSSFLWLRGRPGDVGGGQPHKGKNFLWALEPAVCDGWTNAHQH